MVSNKCSISNTRMEEFLELDSTLRRHRRSVIFDVDAVDAAVAELERLYASIFD